MLLLFQEILPLAFGAAISPMLFAATVVILAGRSNRRARALAFLAGAACPLIALALVITAIVKATVTFPSFRLRLSPAIDLGIGLLLLLLALLSFALPRTQGEPRPATALRAETTSGAHWVAFYSLGLALMAPNPATLALFALAAWDIGRAEVGAPAKAVAFLLIVIVTLAPIVLPLVLDLLAPAFAHRVLEPIGRAARSHRRLIGGIVMALLGGYLVARGLLAL